MTCSQKGDSKMKKKVFMKIDRYNSEVTLRDVMAKIKDIQAEHPDMDVFFDGDEYAICGRQKPKK